MLPFATLRVWAWWGLSVHYQPHPYILRPLHFVQGFDSFVPQNDSDTVIASSFPVIASSFTVIVSASEAISLLTLQIASVIIIPSPGLSYLSIMVPS